MASPFIFNNGVPPGAQFNSLLFNPPPTRRPEWGAAHTHTALRGRPLRLHPTRHRGTSRHRWPSQSRIPTCSTCLLAHIRSIPSSFWHCICVAREMKFRLWASRSTDTWWMGVLGTGTPLRPRPAPPPSSPPAPTSAALAMVPTTSVPTIFYCSPVHVSGLHVVVIMSCGITPFVSIAARLSRLNQLSGRCYILLTIYGCISRAKHRCASCLGNATDLGDTGTSAKYLRDAASLYVSRKRCAVQVQSMENHLASPSSWPLYYQEKIFLP